MVRIFVGLLIVGSLLLAWNVSLNGAQVPDGTLKVTTRMVAPGVGLSWGDGVLIYKGQDYPFTFQARGLFRDVDDAITAAELSGQVFNLKSAADFAGKYQKVETETSDSSGTRATMKKT